VSPSGLVYAVIVALWAAVLIPIWLRRHDEAAMTRSADRYSRAMRTLSRRPARIDRREMVVPKRASAAPHVDAARAAPRRAVSSREAPGAARRPTSARAGSAQLARRRARSLLVLGILTVILGVLAMFQIVTKWAVVPAIVLLAAFVVHLRLQARRSADLRRRQSRGATSASLAAQCRDCAEYWPQMCDQHSRMAASERSAAPTQSLDLSRAVVVETKGQTLGGSAAAADPPVAESGQTMGTERVDEGSDDAWRPKSWPVPTYVNKPKAVRPIRVIDLTTPGAWTSGRLLDDEIETQEQTVAEVHKASEELDAIIEQVDPAPSEQRRVVND